MVFIISNTYNSSYLGKFLKEEQSYCHFMDGANIPYKECLKKTYEDFPWEKERKIYSSLEDSHDFLKKNFPNNKNVKKLDLLKNKFLFRESIKQLFPNFEYKLYKEDVVLKASEFVNKPKVLKPISGISSNGVKIIKDLKHTKIHIPKNSIVEDCIEGIELAIDGYYDSCGIPIVLNIMQHDFKNDRDVSDTLYYTNYFLVEKHKANIIDLLHSLNYIFDLSSFPFHLEVKVTKDNDYIPIEMNPFRFAGFGTCEIADYAYGINPYEYFTRDKEPNWKAIEQTLPVKEKMSNFGFYTIESPEQVDHQKVASMFSELLEYRLVNLPGSNIKAIIFFKESNPKVLENLLKSA